MQTTLTSVVSAAVISGDLIIGLSDGSIINCGRVQGPIGLTGDQGPMGATGRSGINGNTILTVQGIPDTTVGKDGDFAINVKLWEIYGPRAGGAWGAGTPLRGNTRGGGEHKDNLFGNNSPSEGGPGKVYNTSNLPLTGLGRSTSPMSVDVPGGNIIPEGVDLVYQANLNKWVYDSLEALDQALPVQTGDVLPEEGAYKGDLFLKDDNLYVWEGVSWIEIGSGGGGGGASVVVAENPPLTPSVGDLWFCTAADDLTLYVYDSTVWVPAAPPVSLDGIEADVTGIQELLDINITPALAGAIGDIRVLETEAAYLVRENTFTKDNIFEGKVEVEPGEQGREAVTFQQLTEGDSELQTEIDNLKQEIEHLKPSYERGEWDLSVKWPETGQYGLYKTTTYAEAVDKINNDYGICILECGETDPTNTECLSDCNRTQVQALAEIKQYDPEEGGTGFIDQPVTDDWELVNRVVFYEKDALGISHSFDQVTEGQFLDLYNKDDEGYFISQVRSITRDVNDEDVIVVDVDPTQWSELPPKGRALIKFFTLEDGVDVADFVKKSGDKMTGKLENTDRIWIHQGKDGAKGVGNCLVVNQDKEKGGSIARFQQDGVDFMKVGFDGNTDFNSHKIVKLADAEDNMDAVNLRTLDKKVGDYVKKSGDLIDGLLTINAPREDKATNSFMIRGALKVDGEVKEGQVIFKDYREGKGSTQDSSMMYFGRISGPNHIINKEYLEQYVADNAGGKSDKVILESGTSVPTLETGRMFLNTTNKMIYVGT